MLREAFGRRLAVNHLHEVFPSHLIDRTLELCGENHLTDYSLLLVAYLDWLDHVSDRTTATAGLSQGCTLLYQRAM